ncbi:glucuronate isomerase [Lederbergia lenta]|nr:glucuronate isomerase [Lederbergia lenta]MCM3112627.1 glucuronate isomerase [Lederbergia lenta]MEC2323665.1 glucuronate isomerase [Lederbergia lenta]
MKKFMDENFLLNNDTAIELYNNFAKDMPIIDYHCHLSPQEIYENKTFKNITEAWLYGDHYKWRVMRANGIEEQYITGDAADYDKFLAWARTVPMLIGNPLHHWTHLELQRFFGIYELLNEESAPKIWEQVNAQLNGEGFGARDLILKSNVKVVCTTDDPIDSLEYHSNLKSETDFDVKVLPSFRPDKGLEINLDGYADWVQKLAEASGQPIEHYEDFLNALSARMEYFHSMGGRVSDHALNTVMYEDCTVQEAATIFAKGLSGEKVTLEEEKKYKSFTFTYIGKEYARLGWVMQYHMNALRNNNEKMFNEIGADAGYDSINDSSLAKPLSQLLNSLEREDALPKTILYSLNPQDNYVLGTMIGNFQGGGVAGKIQFGTAWWFNDQKDGMLDQMKALANLGLFSRFIGMLTDSRSFLSFTRHEYFRRITCDLIGGWVEDGEYPKDMVMLEKIVKGICYDNANEYFQFDRVNK